MDHEHTELLRRIQNTSISTSFPELDRCLPLSPASTVYIQGPSSVGKSELLLQIVVTCVIPGKWGDVELGGNGANVLYFDNDYKFNLLRFMQILQQRLKRKEQEHKDKGNTTALSNIPQLVKETLSKVLVTQCYDQLQLATTLRAYLTRATFNHVKFVIVDSLDCYYWQEAACQARRSALVSNTLILQLLYKIQTEKNVNVIATISEMYSKGASPSMTVLLDGTIMTFNGEKVEYEIESVTGFSPKSHDSRLDSN